MESQVIPVTSPADSATSTTPPLVESQSAGGVLLPDAPKSPVLQVGDVRRGFRGFSVAQCNFE